jgi:hypothetical protein
MNTYCAVWNNFTYIASKICAAVAITWCSLVSSTMAQLPIANFDTPGNTDGFEPAVPPDFTNSSYLEHNQVNGIGNTSGPGALRVEVTDNNGAGSWAIRFDASSTLNAAAFAAFSQVAQAEEDWFLEFDVTILDGEWDSMPPDPRALLDPGSIFQLNVGVNSDNTLGGDLGGFQQKGDALSNLNFLEGTFNAKIPMTSLPLASGSSFYQLSIGTTANFLANDSPIEGVDLYFDNFRFTQAPPTVEHTLFSWETPDNPATTNIDERFEGWDDTGLNNPGDLNTTVHGIRAHSELGTLPDGWGEGQFALQIDRIDPAAPSTFHWGSNFFLNSDDGNGGVIPAVQERIDELKGLINQASAIAFDLRFDDPDPNSPTFTRLAVYFTDGTGAFFDAEGDSIGSVPIGTSGTYIIPTNIMNDANGSGPLDEVGLQPSGILGIGIATNTDGPGLYQIDNFRVIIEVPLTQPGDFDEDGDVDGRDFLLWQRNPNIGLLSDWQANYGFNGGGLQTVIDVKDFLSATSVPEPGSLLLLALTTVSCGLRRR